MLEGAELIAKTKALAFASRSELVRECGYVSQKEDGSERLNFTAFYEALLKAKGVELKPKRQGRTLSHKAKIQADGKVIVGSAYIDGMNLEPGTVFDIEVGRTKVVLTASAAA